MIPSLPINDHYRTCFCRLPTRRSRARIHPLNLQRTALANTAHSPQRVHSRQLARTDYTDCTIKSSLHASLSQIPALARMSKSP
jgi:hypothetical protein